MDPIARVGSPAPNFELLDLAGQGHSLSDRLGSIVVINFWSAECIHSKRADAVFEELLQAWGEEVSLWCILSNENEDDELVKTAAGKVKIDRLLRDRHQEVADTYGAVTTPHIFLIDQKGVLRYAGAFDDSSFAQRAPTKNYLSQAVGALQKGLSPEPSETKPFGCAIVRHAI